MNKQERKSIELVVEQGRKHWVGDGFYVHGFVGSRPELSMRAMDPFIMLDYNERMTIPPSRVRRGVDVHPHKGFETVTIAYEGYVEHADSAGHRDVIRPGDVQWMTAGRGILHQEYYESEWAERGGHFHVIQLWTNLPAKYKLVEPRYQPITKAQMARYELSADGSSYVEVIAGEYKDAVGPAQTYSPIHLMNAHLGVGAEASFSFPAQYTTTLVVVRGAIEVEGQKVKANHLVKFAQVGEVFNLKGLEADTCVLVMSGEPFHEPMVPYGPFVMNTEEEIHQAIADYRAGRFGSIQA